MFARCKKCRVNKSSGIMKKGTLTREQAIEIVGVDAVVRVEQENCDFTNRVGYNGSIQGDAEVEFSASVRAEDKDGNDVSLIAYYYQDAEAVDENELDCLDWEICGHEVI